MRVAGKPQSLEKGVAQLGGRQPSGWEVGWVGLCFGRSAHNWSAAACTFVLQGMFVIWSKEQTCENGVCVAAFLVLVWRLMLVVTGQ